ncbi:MAG: L-threonylcarbamoyladenylate synthase [Chloroflexota bacterium]
MAKIVRVDALRPDPALLKRAAALLAAGEVLVCPTDTGYALAADARNEGAIDRVFSLKGRSFNNPIHVAVGSLAAAGKYARVGTTARRLAKAFLPGALTVVLPRKDTIPPRLVGGMGTVGIRIPDNAVILGLLARARMPVTTTSANISGQPTPYEVGEIVNQMGKDLEGIAMVLDQGEITSHELSTIVDLTVKPTRLLRPGRIPWEEIQRVLQQEGE